MVRNHYAAIAYNWDYAHDQCLKEEIYKQVLTLEDLSKKMGKMKGAKGASSSKSTKEMLHKEIHGEKQSSLKWGA